MHKAAIGIVDGGSCCANACYHRKECCEKGTPVGRTPFRNLRKLDWCEGRLLER
jgi:hypothetical protein